MFILFCPFQLSHHPYNKITFYSKNSLILNYIPSVQMNTANNKYLKSHSKDSKKISKTTSNDKKIKHKKQIQATLNQIYLLQSQILKLNVPQNPHSSSPVKKQIKNLSLIYENMIKPKVKNNLNIKMQDIKAGLNIINQGFPHQQSSEEEFDRSHQEKIRNQNQISLINNSRLMNSNNQQTQSQEKIDSETLKHVIKQIFDFDVDVSLISGQSTQKNKDISAAQIYKFLNFSEFDDYDPLKQAYNCLLDEDGKFNIEKYNKINQMFGLPEVDDFFQLKQVLGLNENEQITFDKFKQIIQNEKDLYFMQ